jgi:hypothetical protein
MVVAANRAATRFFICLEIVTTVDTFPRVTRVFGRSAGS